MPVIVTVRAPTLVSFLPAFWFLVPGVLGLIGVTKYLGAGRLDGIAALMTTGATMVAIARGVLLGTEAGTVVSTARGKASRRG
jgi:uncharacterized membrane protein YjjB (DUF3815 family)